METCTTCGGQISATEKPYQYDECGLPVILHGVTQYTCPRCQERYAAIHEPERLHHAIGAILCQQRKAILKPEEIIFLRKNMGLKAKEFAGIMGVTPSTVSRWENGVKDMGEAHDRLLRLLYLLFIERAGYAADSADLIHVFSAFPHHRKKIDEPRTLDLQPGDWLASPACCPA